MTIALYAGKKGLDALVAAGTGRLKRSTSQGKVDAEYENIKDEILFEVKREVEHIRKVVDGWGLDELTIRALVKKLDSVLDDAPVADKRDAMVAALGKQWDTSLDESTRRYWLDVVSGLTDIKVRVLRLLGDGVVFVAREGVFVVSEEELDEFTYRMREQAARSDPRGETRKSETRMAARRDFGARFTPRLEPGTPDYIALEDTLHDLSPKEEWASQYVTRTAGKTKAWDETTREKPAWDGVVTAFSLTARGRVLVDFMTRVMNQPVEVQPRQTDV